jgi:signal transduction histidine kinase
VRAYFPPERLVSPIKRLIPAIVCVTLAILLIGTGGERAIAAEPTAYQMTPIGFVDSYEKLKVGASIETLEAFGRNALNRRGEDRLSRLHLVASEFEMFEDATRFEKWNAQLRSIAEKEGNQRFVNLADANTATLKVYNSPTGDTGPLKTVLKQTQDPLVRSIVINRIAFFDVNISNTVGALKKMSEAHALIPETDPAADIAMREYWDQMASTLLGFNDIEGATAAAARAYFSYTPSDFRSPNTVVLTNLIGVARRVGDEALARRTHQALSRLAIGTGDPARIAAAAVDCAMIENNFDHPTEALKCLDGVDFGVLVSKIDQVKALSVRSMSRARLGDTELAKVDFEELKRWRASGEYNPLAFANMPLIESVILANEGRALESHALAMEFWSNSQRRLAGDFRRSIHELTNTLQSDLDDLRRGAELQKKVIRLQWILAGLALLLCLAAIVAVYSLRKMNQRLVQASNAKSAFLANISHEIRTPLNGILGLAQAISADQLAPEQAERIEVLKRSGMGLLAILNDLLDLAKIEAGRMTIEAAPFSPEEVLTASRNAIWATAEAKGLTVETVIDPSARGIYQGDGTRLRQIVDNLVSNAVKFTPTGSVKVSLSRSADRLILTVKDTGIGMTPEAAIRIFSRFEQAESSTTRRFGGTGLGLSICRELVKAMKGEITVSSAVGKGSTFVVTLPLERLSDNHIQPLPKPEGQMLFNGPPLRVLVAEDHPVNQLVLKTLLAQLGINITLVGDGAQVLQRYQDEDWDIVLMDVQMPVMDGVAATRAMRALEQDRNRKPTPVIALTANNMAHQIEEYRKAGFSGHVPKPIDAMELIWSIRHQLPDRWKPAV